MTNLLLGIFICIILVVLYIRPMEHGADVTDAEIEEWLDWREEWKRRQEQRTEETK